MTLSKTTIDTRASSSLSSSSEYRYSVNSAMFFVWLEVVVVLLQNGHVYAKPIDSLSVINQSGGFSDDAL